MKGIKQKTSKSRFDSLTSSIRHFPVDTFQTFWAFLDFYAANSRNLSPCSSFN
jgi:hypothetical protein